MRFFSCRHKREKERKRWIARVRLFRRRRIRIAVSPGQISLPPPTGESASRTRAHKRALTATSVFHRLFLTSARQNLRARRGDWPFPRQTAQLRCTIIYLASSRAARHGTVRARKLAFSLSVSLLSLSIARSRRRNEDGDYDVRLIARIAFSRESRARA